MQNMARHVGDDPPSRAGHKLRRSLSAGLCRRRCKTAVLVSCPGPSASGACANISSPEDSCAPEELACLVNNRDPHADGNDLQADTAGASGVVLPHILSHTPRTCGAAGHITSQSVSPIDPHLVSVTEGGRLWKHDYGRDCRSCKWVQLSSSGMELRWRPIEPLPQDTLEAKHGQSPATVAGSATVAGGRLRRSLSASFRRQRSQDSGERPSRSIRRTPSAGLGLRWKSADLGCVQELVYGPSSGVFQRKSLTEREDPVSEAHAIPRCLICCATPMSSCKPRPHARMPTRPHTCIMERCHSTLFQGWACFSLRMDDAFGRKSIDFAVIGEENVKPWLLGLHRALVLARQSLHLPLPWSMWSVGNLCWERSRLRLHEQAHRTGCSPAQVLLNAILCTMEDCVARSAQSVRLQAAWRGFAVRRRYAQLQRSLRRIQRMPILRRETNLTVSS